MMNIVASKRELVLLVIGCMISSLPVWLTEYPPMSDLPQHVGQVSILLNYEKYSDIFRINLFTPYLLGYGLLYLVGLFVNLILAAKILLIISFTLTVVFTRRLLINIKTNTILAWLVIPVNYGFAFYYGFFTFLLVIPVLLIFLCYVFNYLDNPTVRKGVVLTLAGIVLFFSHAILYGIGMVISCLLANVKHGKPGFRYMVPFILTLPVSVLWYKGILASEAGSTLTTWDLGIFRIPQIFSYTIGMEAHIYYVLIGILLYACPFLLGGRLTRKNWRWVPFIVLLSLFLFMPILLSNTLFMYERLSVILFITYLLLFDLPQKIAAYKILMLSSFLLSWLSVISYAFYEFGLEQNDFKSIVSIMPDDKRTLSLIFKTKSNVIPDHPLYLHFTNWVQTVKGGIVDFNFANFYPQIVRFQNDKVPKVSYGFDSRPQTFDWNQHEGNMYDYYIIRSAKDVANPLFREYRGHVEIIKHAGTWWLFKNTNR